MKLGSLFDGIGGFPLAGTRHGIEPVWASEIEPFPINVTKERFPGMVHLGDITKIDGASIEPVDIITFGSPCQDLSIAGKRAGMQHTDKGDETTTRSGLFMEAVRIIKEMRDATRRNGSADDVRPRWAVWENVPGAYSSNKGEDFRVVLEELTRVCAPSASIPRPARKWLNDGAIVGDGWSIAWRTLDAQYWGVPQRRRRIYLVCDFAGGCAPEILFEREGLRRHIAQSGEAGEGVATDAQGSVTTAGGNNVISTLFAAYGTKWNGNSGAVTGDHFVMDNAQRGAGDEFICSATQRGGAERFVNLAPTLTASAGMAGNMGPWIGPAGSAIPINDQATHVNGGCNGSMVGKPDDPMYSLTATDRHAVAWSINHQGGNVEQILKDVTGTITAATNSSGNNKLSVALYENHGQDSRLTGPLAISPTVAAKFGTGGNNTPLVTAYGVGESPDVAHCIRAGASKADKHESSTYIVEHYRKSRRAQSADDAETWVPDAVANTVNCFDVGDVRAVDIVMAHGQANAEIVENGSPALTCNHEQPILFKDKSTPTSMSVRRLTPLEAERLQGFPDGWTDIQGGSDSARYKALGNSLAGPTAEFVLEGIAEVAQ